MRNGVMILDQLYNWCKVMLEKVTSALNSILGLVHNYNDVYMQCHA